MIEEYLAEVERLQKIAQSQADNKESLLASRHQFTADALGTVLELVRSNAQSLRECRMCGGLYFGSASKLYCSNKCRQMAFKKL